MANYPPTIKLDEKTNERLVSYLEEELTRHYAERGDLVKELESWQFDYNAEPSGAETTFPFSKGGATLIVPLTAITVEASHSRTFTTMFALDQFVTAKTVASKYQAHARPVERFLDNELLKRVGIRKPLNDALLESTKYGSGVIKTGYEKIVKTVVREVNGKEQDYEYVVRANATCEAVPLARFLMPFYYQDPQLAAWCGEEHEYSPYEIRLHEISEFFEEGTMEKLNAHFTTVPADGPGTGASFQNNQEKSEKAEPLWPEKITVQEIWLGFDVAGGEELVNAGTVPRESFKNGFDKEIVVFYHRPSRTILSTRYNWFEDLHRPYDTGVYFPVEHRWRGIGVCKQVAPFQIEITTQHRQRIDNATLANCRMFKVSKLSDYGPNEPVFPGKIWWVDNMDEVQTLQMGEIYSSSYSNEAQALTYLQQRTGINEMNLGMPQAGTPGTATSDLARIQEGNKKHDFTYGNHRAFGNSVLDKLVLNIKQFGTRATAYYEMVDDGQLVKEFFDLDYEVIKHDLALKINIASQQDNKLLDRQNTQQLIQAMQAYQQGVTEFAQIIADPELIKRAARSGMYASTELMRQILESFDKANIDRLIFKEALADGFTTAAGGSNSAPAGVAPTPGSGIPATPPG